MSNILEEVKKPLTKEKFEWELVRLANIMNAPIPAGCNPTKNSKAKDARAIYMAQCIDTDRIHAAIDKSINGLSKNYKWLIARIEDLERERKEAATLIRYSVECLDAINAFTASIPSSAATEGVRQILDEYEARLPTPPIEGSAS